jgi:NAD-dependent dihydropyrimidine dehydrogenase PreA subunit
LVETAAVVSLPKLKTHFLTILTGALKNGLGLIPGLAKAEFHRLAPHPDDFAELLVDLAPALQPAFTFVDAVVGLEGDGPASGEVRPFGLVVAGANGAAVDVVLARLCGFEPEEVPTVRLSLARGLAPAEPEVVLLGLRETDLIFDDVAAPGSLWLRHLPRPVLRFAGKQFVIRPVVRGEACTGCGRCVESCPVGAARMEGERATIDPAKCIQCLCCYETCADEAVYLRPSRAARLYYGFRDFKRRWRDRRRGA